MTLLDKLKLGQGYLGPEDFAEKAAKAGFQVGFITQNGQPLLCLVATQNNPRVETGGLRLLGRVPQSVKGRPRVVEAPAGLIALRVWNVDPEFFKAAQKECQAIGIELPPRLSLTTAERRELGQEISAAEGLRILNRGFDEKVNGEIEVDAVVVGLDQQIRSGQARVVNLQKLRDQRAKVLREEREERRADFIDVAGGREL